jgi:dolichyl-diphosphooligosaccharide--protein glycosyltransferase
MAIAAAMGAQRSRRAPAAAECRPTFQPGWGWDRETMKLARDAERRSLRILTPVGLFLLAVAVRSLPWQTVLMEERVYFFGNDAYYHLRRIVYSLVHFPALLDFDPYISFPMGAKPIWTPVFDWGVALLLRPFFDGDLDSLERIVVWLPPVLGGATVLALYFLANKHFDKSVAVLSGVVLSVLSAHFWYSQIGFVDHHAAVALTSTLLLAAAMGLLYDHLRDPVGLKRGWKSGLTTGVALAVTLLVWPGSLLHVGLVESALLAYLLTRWHREEAVGFAIRFSLLNGAAFLLVLPFGAGSSWPQWSDLSPVVLSKFQPWLFGTLAVFGAACAGLWRRTGVGRARRQRIATAAAVGIGLLAVSGWAFPELMASAEDVWGWLAKRDSFQADVAESQPLFALGGRFVTHIATSRLSLFVFLFPVALVGCARSVRRERHRAPVLLLLWWSLSLFVVTLFQKRFFNSSSVALALLMAWSVLWIYRALPPFVLESPRGRGAARGVLVAVVLVLLYPVFDTYRPHLWNQPRAFSGRPIEVKPFLVRRKVMTEMAKWLRRNTPQTSGWLDVSQKPEYGVMAPWPVGHVMEYVGRRPTITDNFGDDIGEKNFLLARRYYQSREKPAVEILDRLGVRYIVAQQSYAYLGESALEGSMFHSLYFLDGSEFVPGAGGAGRQAVNALERHRLIYESRSLVREPDQLSVFKVFEYVPGARVSGRAAPGAEIRVTLLVRTNRGREIVYSNRTLAGEDGRYALRLPYANRGGPRVVKVAPYYTLECAGGTAHIEIREENVRSGEELAGPDLCRHRRGRPARP